MKWYGIFGLVIQSTVWIAVVFVLTVWVYLGLSEYFSYYFRFGLRRPAASLGVAGESSTTSRGLQPTEMERYPKFSYPKDEENTSSGITDCVVCLGQFVEGETLRLIPLCGHVFHADCVDVWLRSHATCPCCRANLRLPPPEPTVDSPV